MNRMCILMLGFIVSFILLDCYLVSIIHSHASIPWKISAKLQQKRKMRYYQVESSNATKKSFRLNIVLWIVNGSTMPKFPLLKERAHQSHVFCFMSMPTYMTYKDDLYTNGDIKYTITNSKKDNDYIAFLTSFYYPSDYVIIMKLNSTETASLLTKAINELLSAAYNHLEEKNILVGNVQSSKTADISWNFLCMSSSELRHFYTHSSLNISSPSLFHLLPQYADRNSAWSLRVLPSFSRVSVHQREEYSVAFKKCIPLPQDSSLTVFIRVYRRDYLSDQLQRVVQQITKPTTIVIQQNENYRMFDYDALEREFGMFSRIVFIWHVNWNAFFHYTYLLSSLASSTYSIVYDDDQLLKSVNTHSTLLEAVKKESSFCGLRAWCWCKAFNQTTRYKPCEEQCAATKTGDLIANPIAFYSVFSKYMWRYAIPTYYCCEEMSLLLAANVECGISWKYMKMDYLSYQQDKHDRSRDPATKTLMKAMDWHMIDHVSMAFYIRAGYKPSFPYDPKYCTMNRSIYPI